MSLVDTHGADVQPDISTTAIKALEKVQTVFLCRLLGLGSKVMRAVLFSETGIWPIADRRANLALRYLAYLIDVPHDRLTHRALNDSAELALEGKRSWYADLRIALRRLGLERPLPELRDVSPEVILTLRDELKALLGQKIVSALAGSPKTYILAWHCAPKMNGTSVSGHIFAFP